MKRYLKVNQKIIRNSAIQLVIFFILFSFSLTFFRLYKVNQKEERMDNKHVYFDLQQESSPFSVPLEKYYALYAQLCDHFNGDYYECYLQYLEEMPASHRFFDYETEALSENCQAALCVQISENLQKSNDLKCDAGRLLNSDDYQFRKDTVPVILGYEYRDLFPLGSQFSATYLYNVYTFEVVGILEKNSKIDNPLETIYLDKYIIMPSFHVLEFPENREGICIHYANKTSGILIARKEDFTTVSNDLKQILSNAECGNYSVNISPVKYSVMDKTGIRIEWFLILLFAAAFISAVSYIKYVCKEKKDIMQNILLFTCAEFVCSFLLFTILYQLFLHLFLPKTVFALFFVFDLFIIFIQNVILIFQKKYTSHFG